MQDADFNIDSEQLDNEVRVLPVAGFIRPTNASDPIRSVVLETAESVIVVWHVQPGQEIAAHVHPYGQDTWTVLSGRAEYYQGGGLTQIIKPYDIVVARPDQIHGARTIGKTPLVFVSVVAPGNAGYRLAEK